MLKYIINYDELSEILANVLNNVDLYGIISNGIDFTQKNTKLPEEVTYTEGGILQSGTGFIIPDDGSTMSSIGEESNAVGYIDFGNLRDLTRLDGTGFYAICCTCDKKYTISFNMVDKESVMDATENVCLFNVNVSKLKTVEELVESIENTAETKGFNDHWIKVIKDPENPRRILLFDRRSFVEADTSLNRGVFVATLPEEIKPPDVELDGILEIPELEGFLDPCIESEDEKLEAFKNFFDKLIEVDPESDELFKIHIDSLTELDNYVKELKKQKELVVKKLDRIVNATRMDRRDLSITSNSGPVPPVKGLYEFQIELIGSIKYITITTDGYDKKDYITLRGKDSDERIYLKEVSQTITMKDLDTIAGRYSIWFHNKSGHFRYLFIEIGYYNGEFWED